MKIRKGHDDMQKLFFLVVVVAALFVGGATLSVPAAQASAFPAQVGAVHTHAALACPPTVSEGSTGSTVVRLQNDLNEDFGFPIVVVDGIFGQKTKNAVVEFQQQVNLTPDGIVGPHTWHALEPFTC